MGECSGAGLVLRYEPRNPQVKGTRMQCAVWRGGSRERAKKRVSAQPGPMPAGFSGMDKVETCVCGLLVAVLVAGCSVTTKPQGLGYGHYTSFNCTELTAEAKRLVRVVADRSEHLLADDAARRGEALTQLSAARRAMADKNCQP